MKVCPSCQKTYNDDGLNFCLEDGATLMPANAADNAPPATVLMNQPRPTDPQMSFGNQPDGSRSGWNASPNQAGQNQFSMPPPPKKSKGWLWALGILGAIVVLCGGGGLGFLAYLGSQENNRNADYAPNASNSYNAAQKSPTPANRANVQKIDLSKWVQNDQSYGVTEYSGGELLMKSNQENYYYVLTAGTLYKTEDATTKVAIRNVNRESTDLGFGLVIHSNPTPLKQDYAFLIDSENKKYRVVRHSPGEEIAVVGWTRAAAIKDGDQKNILEVRDQNKKMTFFINGELIRAFDNEKGYSGGVAGLYSGDAVQIAFSDFEISK